MFGIGPLELALFLVIVLLAVGPDKLPTFMRTVGKALRQVRNASREFKDAIGLDELLREGDPFRAPPVRPPRARPVPLEDKEPPPDQLPSVSPPSAQPATLSPPPIPKAPKAPSAAPSAPADEPAPESEPDASAEAKHP
ncbi:MAG: twin-arginine translocase TatA/TatE family subunit [Myxococcales bacterium]|nr:twin-arginine translocase TatA/TatE family subunit [Myxococcales bacterium]